MDKYWQCYQNYIFDIIWVYTVWLSCINQGIEYIYKKLTENIPNLVKYPQLGISYLEGHQNRHTGSKVTTILLKGSILPIGGVSAVEGLPTTGLPRLLFKYCTLILVALIMSHKRIRKEFIYFGNHFNVRPSKSDIFCAVRS